MKITQTFAQTFANEWINAWNNKDLGDILNHYAEDVTFSSPFILKNQPNKSGTISGKEALEKYFRQALEKNPDLHFELKHIMVGIKSITLIYIRKKVMLASEVMVLNEQGKITEGLSHYPAEEIDSI